MTIQGLDNAIHIAIDRAIRSREVIYVVQISHNDFILWREVSIEAMKTLYEYHKIVAKVDKNGNITK